MSATSGGEGSRSSWGSSAKSRVGLGRRTKPAYDASIAKYETSPITLEVMRGTEMSRLLQSSATAAGTAVCVAIVGILIARYKSVGAEKGAQIVPRYLLILEIIGSVILALMMAAVTTHFGARIFRLFSKNRTRHQLLTFGLAVGLCVALVPTRAIAELAVGNGTGPSRSTLVVDVFQTTVATGVVILYTWMTLRFCREPHPLDDHTEKTSATGNALILTSVSGYVLLRVVTGSLFKIAYASLPLQSFIAFLNIVSTRPSRSVDAGQVVAVCFLTAIEALFIILVARSNRETESFMNSADLNEYRSENIVHRFFKMSAGFIFIPLPLIAVMQFGYPMQRSITILESSGFLLLSSPVGGVAVGIVLFFFGSRQAYVNLPSDTDGLGAWMKEKASPTGPGERPGMRNVDIAVNVSEVSSVSQSGRTLAYRATDHRDRDRGQPTMDPKCFSLESAVLLFNFSWLVYTYGTVGFSPAKPADFGKGEYRVRKHIQDTEHDVHALIVESPERIIVAFKGSNSVANARIDKDTKKVNAVNAFKGENSPAAKALPGIHLNADSTTWRGCKVHRGYASAYAAIRVELVAEIVNIFNNNNRPIFVSGHSSGGAMATLCSFELGTIDSLSGSEFVAVYTYGSPRVGNLKFASVCDGLVQNHWRCVVAGDSTVSMPSDGGYTHVGNMAMFTRNGQLTLEKVVRLRWWQSERSSHPMYKLTSYYCAMMTWAESYSGQTAKEIGLWKWPIDESTSALFKAGSKPRGEESLGGKKQQRGDVENPVALQKTEPSDHVEPESLDDVVAFSK